MIGARHRKLKSFLSSPMESLVHAPKSTERIRSINIISGSKRPNCAHTPTFIHTSPQLCSLRSRIGKSGKRGYKLRCLQCLWMWRWWALEAGLITGHYNIHSWCVLHHDSNDRPLPSLTTASTNTTSMECGTSRHPSPRYYRDLWVWTQVTASIIPILVNYTMTKTVTHWHGRPRNANFGGSASRSTRHSMSMPLCSVKDHEKLGNLHYDICINRDTIQISADPTRFPDRKCLGSAVIIWSPSHTYYYLSARIGIAR